MIPYVTIVVIVIQIVFDENISMYCLILFLSSNQILLSYIIHCILFVRSKFKTNLQDLFFIIVVIVFDQE
jgi:hypothetical protein